MAPDGKKTVVWQVDANRPDPDIIRQAGLVLRQGGLVAFPTETVYGLGANALDPKAVEGIFVAKGRPQDNPLIVHVADIGSVPQYVLSVSEKARLLMNEFWPGPLTLIMEGNGKIARSVSAGLNSLAFRMPDHPVALALVKAAAVPVAAPSANLSGKPSPTTAQHVYYDLQGRIDVILNGGQAAVGVESTVLDMTVDPPVILRPGGVTPEQIESVAGPVELDRTLVKPDIVPIRPRSPGMKYRHYAPAAPLVLVEGRADRVVREIRRLAEEYIRRGKRVGVLCRSENREKYGGVLAVDSGAEEDGASVAARLYDALRSFDSLDVDIILAEGVEASGIGLAVANRLRRAAGGKIIRV